MNCQTDVRLDEITSHWSQIVDPMKFVYRYSPAIRAYVSALTSKEGDIDDIVQDFLVKFLDPGFVGKFQERGRFRDFLKICVRNVAISHLRKQKPKTDSVGEFQPAILTTNETPGSIADRQWVDTWRQCVLDKAWRALDHHERHHDGNLFHSVLQMTVQHPEKSSEFLSNLLCDQREITLTAESFRKQLSRARRMFAHEICREVQTTLINSDSSALQQELQELGLSAYIAIS